MLYCRMNWSESVQYTCYTLTQCSVFSRKHEHQTHTPTQTILLYSIRLPFHWANMTWKNVIAIDGSIQIKLCIACHAHFPSRTPNRFSRGYEISHQWIKYGEIFRFYFVLRSFSLMEKDSERMYAINTRALLPIAYLFMYWSSHCLLIDI